MKNGIVAICICLGFSALAAAEQGTPPSGWKINFGLEERLRVESKSDLDLNSSLDDNGSLIFQRLKLNGRAVLKDRLEFFAELMDLRVGNARIAKTDQADNLDLHQAYFMANNVFGTPVAIKAGRQELKYGKGRLLWAATWANRINHTDAVVARYKTANLSADIFYGSRVLYDEDGWNQPNRHDTINGAYLSYQKGKESTLAETYFISNLDPYNISTLRRYTAGFRTQFRVPSGVVCDIELPYQFGKSGGKTINAYAFHFDASREFAAIWNPVVAAAINIASGDRKSGDSETNTFIPLYQSVHDPYGLMDLFRWQNMREAAVEVALNPGKKWKIIPATNFFWLDNNHDSWYDSSGKKFRTDTTGKTDNYVGQELSMLIKYDFSDTVKLDAAYAHFFAGPYAADTGSGSDADWVYFQLNLKI